jgi:hypothetical protein
MEKTFTFTEEDKYVCNINSKTILNIKRISDSIAVLYLTDESNNEINIPNGLIVYEYDYHNISKRVVLKPCNNTYPLCWTDNYTIELNKTVLINIKNQRRWSIIS